MNLIAAITGIGFALNPLTALSGAPQSGALEAGGVWVTLCATGSEVWIDFSGEGRKPDGPPPAQPHIKACHAVCCQRTVGDLNDGSIDKAD